MKIWKNNENENLKKKWNCEKNENLKKDWKLKFKKMEIQKNEN